MQQPPQVTENAVTNFYDIHMQLNNTMDSIFKNKRMYSGLVYLIAIFGILGNLNYLYNALWNTNIVAYSIWLHRLDTLIVIALIIYITLISATAILATVAISSINNTTLEEQIKEIILNLLLQISVTLLFTGVYWLPRHLLVLLYNYVV